MGIDIKKFLNKLIALLLPKLNKALPGFIKSEGLDPYGNVAGGSKTLGKINLGICTASAKASYSIKDLKGLSSITINSIVIDSISSGTSLPNVKGTLTLSAKFKKNLSAKVGGKFSAGCGFIHKSIGIGGKVTAKGVTAKGTASFTAALSLTQSCLTDINIKKLSINYSDVDASINGLGIFNKFLQPLVDLINSIFGKQIKGAISGAVKNALNGLLHNILPVCNK